MIDPKMVLFFDFAVALFVAFELAQVLRTGRARVLLAGTITRERQPAHFRAYVVYNYAVLAFCAAVFALGYFWPDLLR